ncbi:MAG: hypothetical protein H6605_03890 [Flavobacteriales bacterium]|nr:hypothetical protein [Flavobacteriales bacterium]
MEQDISLKSYIKQAHLLMLQGFRKEDIEETVKNAGCPESDLDRVLTGARRLKNAKRTENGGYYLAVGGAILAIGFASCVFLHYSGGSMMWALYGLTMAGLVILFIGLYKIFQ